MTNHGDTGQPSEVLCDTPSSAFRPVDRPQLQEIRTALARCLGELQEAASLRPGQVLVVGASSSEIIGQRIGTATSLEVGAVLVETVLEFRAQTGVDVAFQCCEHLNRALVVERGTAVKRGWTEVSAIPVPGAGGAVAAVAYQRLMDAVLVEQAAVDAGIDIGDTFIGMHLKRVAVPVRPSRNEIGKAHVTMARTRPPLIGGVRAVYDEAQAKHRLQQGANEL